MIRLVFLGRLRDAAGCAQLSAAPGPLEQVLGGLPLPLREAIADPRVKLALNGELVAAAGLVLADGDELAFLPPVSGG